MHYQRRTGRHNSCLYKNMVSRTSSAIIYMLISACVLCTDALNKSENIVQRVYHEQSTTPVNVFLISDQLNDLNRSVAEGSLQNKYFRDKTKLSSLMGNELWSGIVSDCLDRPTFSCFQKNVYSYLDTTLQLQDVNVTNSLKFIKNEVDLNSINRYTKEANDIYNKNDNSIPDDENNDDEEEEDEARSGNHINVHIMYISI